MTDSPILEDTIAKCLRENVGYHWWPSVVETAARDLAEALRAAGVVPPEPAGHDTLRQAAQRLVDHAQEVRFNPNEMSVRFHDWKALRAAVAAVDGEVLA